MQIINIRNGNETSLYKSMNIKKIIKILQTLYAHTFDNLDNMGKYFEMCTLPKLT